MSVLERQARRPNLADEAQFGAPAVPFVEDVDGVPVRGFENIAKATREGRIDTSVPPEEQPLPEFEDAEQAVRIANILKDKGREALGDDRWFRGIEMIKNFEAKNPGAIAEVRARLEEESVEAQFRDEFIDTTPQPSARVAEAQFNAARRTARPFAGINKPNEKKIKSRADLPPVPQDSREAVIDRLEDEGVDTQSGLGNFWNQLGFAVKLNNSSHQMALMMGLALDEIEESGITLPDTVQPITVNQELGVFEFLRPTEDGKLRRTLVEPETLGIHDVAQLADLEELMAGIYAGTAAVRGGPAAARHPFVRELIGDFAGRNVGIMLEATISGITGTPPTMQELAEAFDKTDNLTEAALNTAISRGLTRVGRAIVGEGEAAKRATGQETIEDINANIDEAASVMRDLNEIVDVDIKAGRTEPFTVEAGSLSQEGAQVTGGREKTLRAANFNELERQRKSRVSTLADANKRVAERNSPATAMDYEPHAITEEATGRVNTARQRKVQMQRENIGDIHIKFDPTSGEAKFTFKGETAKPATALGAGELAGDPGVTAIFKDDTVHIVDAFAGEKFAGSNILLMQKVLENAGDRTITLGDSVSPSAQKAIAGLERRGFKFALNEGAKTQPDGTIVNLGPNGVYTMTAIPGQISAPTILADANFDRAVLDSALDDMGDFVGASQMRLDEANLVLKEQIGWSEQRQASDYFVRNPGDSALRQTIRKLDARRRNVLSGAELTEADRKLAAVIRRELDEEGNTVYAGLAGEELDVGNLYNTRAKMAQIFKETQDPDVARVVSNIDGLLTRRDYIHKQTGRARPAARAGIRESVRRANDLQVKHDNLTARVSSSRLFKKNADGEYVNTSVQGLGRLLASDSSYLVHVQPILRESPALKAQTREAVGELYQKQVLDTGSGWSGSKHRTFLNKYRSVIDDMFTGDEAHIIRSFQPPSGLATNRFASAIRAANRKQEQVLANLVPDAETMAINTPDDILGAMRKAGPAKSTRFMRDVQRLDPDMHAGVRKAMIEQTQEQLNRQFFDIDKPLGDLKKGSKLKEWFTDNRAILKAVHGDQYVTDLQTIVNAADLDAKRLRLTGRTPETQSDLIRVLRSILGPLSKPQRRITAANYVNQRRLSAKVLQVYSDPEQLATLKSSRFFKARSDAGMAVATRLGLPEAFGIPTPDNLGDPSTWPPEFRQQMVEMYDWIDDMTGEVKDEERPGDTP